MYRDGSDFVGRRLPHLSSLTVAAWVYAKRCLNPHPNVFDRNQVDAECLGAVDRKVIDLPEVVAARLKGTRVMAVAATCREADGAFAEPTRLALDTCQLLTIVDHEVIANVLPKGTDTAYPDACNACMVARAVLSPIAFGCSIEQAYCVARMDNSREKPEEGLEPTAFALQMRCSTD